MPAGLHLTARRHPAPLRALAALALATALAGTAAAAAVLWVTPVPEGAATLSSEGDVTLHTDGGSELLAPSVRGDSIQFCHGRLLGIDSQGHLRALSGTDVGPTVSLHSRPACLADGRVVAIASGARSVLLLSPELQTQASVALAALPDGDPTPVGDAVALLTQPTQRYRHGILGDEIEAGALTLLRQDDLSTVATLTLAAPAVIEQRRVQPFPAAGRYGMLITRSTPTEGAGVQAVALEDGALAVVAAAPPIGSGERWLNLFAAHGDHAYAVRTPHIRGPLERYALTGRDLTVARFGLDVTNHVIGSRNLDLALLLPPPGAADGAPGRDLLALPSFDRKHVQIVACDTDGCAIVRTLPLQAALSSNLTAAWRGELLMLYAGLETGALQRFTLGAALWSTPTTP